VNENNAVSGKLVLELFNIGDRLPQRTAWDEYARQKMRRELDILLRPE
jgi:hypothetical protein